MFMNAKTLWTNIAFLLISLTAVMPLVNADDDPILEFYCKRAASVFDGHNPLESGLNYTFVASTKFNIFDDRSKLLATDSTEQRYFYSFGQLDSTQTIYSGEEIIDDSLFVYPNIFTGNYNYNFYPNDTGGASLAIGFDTESFTVDQPYGFALIDRDRYILKGLYLYWNHDRRDQRYSMEYSFIEHESFIFPGEVIVTKAKRSIFSVEYFRIETKISQIEIHR